MEYMYKEITQIFAPGVYTYGKKGEALVYEDMEAFFIDRFTDEGLFAGEERVSRICSLTEILM